ncbi:MAG TPA: hypothetical protein VOA41_20270 [Candidatus Dormibacteraeota bacterium]|nr:hypothetical protein [Candidatus Dormibacteraeota bacterium]
MATGRMAFSGTTSGVIFDFILNRTPTPAGRVNPDLPPELERIINKALEKDRDVRYQHASELRADLKRLRRDTDSGRSAPQGIREEEVRATQRRRRKWAAFAAAALAAFVAAGGYSFMRFFRAPAAAIDSIAVLIALPNAGRSSSRPAGRPRPNRNTVWAKVRLNNASYFSGY